MGIAVVAMVFLFNMVYCMCWLPLVITYPMEIVTTKQRGIFFSWTMFVINSSAFVVSFPGPFPQSEEPLRPMSLTVYIDSIR